MKRNAARADMVQRVARRLLGLLGALVLLVIPALAGDRALIEVIGYSRDSHYLAFEEFGIQDGSGFAYSTVYVIDLVEDNWVVGTPIRKLADKEETSLLEVRAEAREKAGETLATLGIDAPVQVLAMAADGAPDMDGQSLHFGLPGYGIGDVMGDYRLTLSTGEVQAMTPCNAWFGARAIGFSLAVADGDQTRLVHQDDTLPRSRGCPVNYRIYAVLAPWVDDPLPHAVALISIYAQGFEGPDRRFLAVPLGF